MRFVCNPRFWAVLLLFALGRQALHAGEPAIRNLDVRGLQIGGTTTLILDGDELGKSPRLFLPFPAKVVVKPGSTGQRATMDVTLPGDGVPGYYQARVLTDQGVSLPVVIGVDRLPQKILSAKVDRLPIALHGVVGGSSIVETKFTGKAKQKVLIEVEAQRLGSKLRPILHLYAPNKLQLSWSWTSPSLFGDTRLEAVLPEDGTYTITLHDAEYGPPGPGFFRLKIGDWSFADQVFPPVLARGQARKVELLGMLSPVFLDFVAPKNLGAVPLPWPKEGIWCGPRPFVRISPHAELVRQLPPEKLQGLPEGRVGVSSRLLTPYSEDRYRIPVTPGKKLRLEVFAERYGAPLDAALVLRNEKGDLLARAEDGPGTLDPVLEYTVPAPMKTLIVGVADAQGRGGPRGVYHLTIDPQTASPTRQGFKLTTNSQRISLPVGGRCVVPVLIERQGYQGKVELTAAGLPGGIRLEGAVISEGLEGALVTVTRDGTGGNAGITNWRGRGTGGVEETVMVKGHPLQQLQPWLASEIALAPTSFRATDFQIDWRDLSPKAGLVPAGKLVLPVKIARSDPKTIVKLTLLTGQRPVLVNNQPDLNKTLRQEKLIELGPKVAAGDLTVLVPAELSAAAYDLAIQGDLLSADKGKVLATAYTSVRRLEVRQLLVVRLNGSGPITALLDPKKGATVKIQGKIERREGLKSDVTLTLSGLPPGVSSAPVTLKAGISDFTMNLVLPANFTAGQITGLKLTASAAPDPKRPNVRVRSRDVEIFIKVQVSAKK